MLGDFITNVLMSKLIMDHYTKEMHLLKSSKAGWEKTLPRYGTSVVMN